LLLQPSSRGSEAAPKDWPICCTAGLVAALATRHKHSLALGCNARGSLSARHGAGASHTVRGFGLAPAERQSQNNNKAPARKGSRHFGASLAAN